MSRPAEQDAASSLSKGLALLELFSIEEDELSVSEMARRSGTPKSTTPPLGVGPAALGGARAGRCRRRVKTDPLATGESGPLSSIMRSAERGGLG